MNENQDKERFISIIEEGREPYESDVCWVCDREPCECDERDPHIDIPALMAATTSAMLEAFLPDVTLVTLDQTDELRRWYDQ